MIDCCALLCEQVLQENEQLEQQLAQVRGGNFRAAQILTAPAPEQDSRDEYYGGHPPQAVATVTGGFSSSPPHEPPPPTTAAPKRPRHDDD